MILVVALIATASTPALAWESENNLEDNDTYGPNLAEDCDESEITGKTMACPSSYTDDGIQTQTKDHQGPSMTAPDNSENDLSECQGLAEEMGKTHNSRVAIGQITHSSAVLAYGSCVRENQRSD